MAVEGVVQRRRERCGVGPPCGSKMNCERRWSFEGEVNCGECVYVSKVEPGTMLLLGERALVPYRLHLDVVTLELFLLSCISLSHLVVAG
jgi:hypothetical protein